MRVKDEKGITLLELVVSLAIFVIVILTALSVLDLGERSFSAIDNDGQIQTEAYNAASLISRQVRESVRVSVIETQPQVISMIDQDGNSRNIVWDSSNHELSLIKDNTGEKKVLSGRVSSFKAAEIGKGVEIDIELALKNQKFRLKTKAFRRVEN